METSIHRRRRIMLHFFLGIGLPSLLLGYLAFRGIQNDVALLGEERLSEHKAIAQKVIGSFGAKIVMVEEAFLDSIADLQPPLGDPTVLSPLENLKARQHLIEEVFVFDDSEKIQFHLAKLQFIPGVVTNSPSSESQPAALLLGRQYEFQGQSFQEALTSYRQVFSEASADSVKGEALSAIARVQKKSNLFSEAMKSYKEIA